MPARQKPIFYRRKRRVLPGLVVLLSITGLVLWMMVRPGGPLASVMDNLPALYQWIPAGIMWMILIIMLSMAVFGTKRED
jgi:hypothetical protein